MRAVVRGPDDPVHLEQGPPAVEVIILAAGQGTRMRSSLPKVLHPLAGKPMLVRVLDTLAAAGFDAPTVVAGFGAEQVAQVVGDRARLVRQELQHGTGDAARVGLEALPGQHALVVVVHGDEPLIPADAYRRMLDLQREHNAAVVLLTTRVADTRGFGRVLRREGLPTALVQEADLTPEQRTVNEVNLGAYVFDAAFLRAALPRLQPHPPKDEYYLTDVVAAAVAGGRTVAALEIPGGEAVMGINDLVQLEEATQALYRATNRRLMAHGVTVVDSASTFVDEEASIAADTVLHPFTIICGPTMIGRGCQIGPGARISRSTIGNDCRVVDSTLDDAWVGDGVSIGPYARLRQGAHLDAGVEIGNFAEVKNATLAGGTKMHHFSYVGDAQIGVGVNIGAGTVTVNYDGVTKHRTTIGDHAFIGSGSMLRAPVTIGARAKTGTGAVVTHDVPAGVVVVGVPARPLPPREQREEPHAGTEDLQRKR